MPTGLSSNPDNITAKDRQVLVGPPPDGDGAGAPTPGPSVENTDTLADLTPTKGRLVVGDGSAWNILEPSASGYFLMLDPSETVGMRWAASGTVAVYVFDARKLWVYGWETDLSDDLRMNFKEREAWLFEEF